jgi:phosphotriesterase-related protein
MNVVNTVLGPKKPEELGKTLVHEHVLIGYPGWFMDARMPPFIRAEALDRAVDAFQQLKAYGVQTVVDPCPMDLGRDVTFNAEVSQRSGINLVSTTGAYFEAEGIPFTLNHFEVQEIADIYQKEIEDGIGGSGIKPGLLKIATGDGRVTDYERKCVTAAARAAKATGLPLLSHTQNCSCGHDQIDIVTGEGNDPHRLLVGHSCGKDDHPYQKSLAERGAYVGFDRFGITIFNSDENRMKNLKQMIDAGFRNSLLLSHDKVNCWMGGIPNVGSPDLVKQVIPNWKMTHLFENIFPALRQMGVSQEDLDFIITENPRRFFAGDSKPH